MLVKASVNICYFMIDVLLTYIFTFIPLFCLLPEGGMSPLPVRKDSGGKVSAAALCVFAYIADTFKIVAAIFLLTLRTETFADSVSCHHYYFCVTSEGSVYHTVILTILYWRTFLLTCRATDVSGVYT